MNIRIFALHYVELKFFTSRLHILFSPYSRQFPIVSHIFYSIAGANIINSFNFSNSFWFLLNKITSIIRFLHLCTFSFDSMKNSNVMVIYLNVLLVSTWSKSKLICLPNQKWAWIYLILVIEVNYEAIFCFC